MILLTVDEIIMLHEKLLRATGGLPGLRDRGLLESAVSMNVRSPGRKRTIPRMLISILTTLESSIKGQGCIAESLQRTLDFTYSLTSLFHLRDPAGRGFSLRIYT